MLGTGSNNKTVRRAQLLVLLALPLSMAVAIVLALVLPQPTGREYVGGVLIVGTYALLVGTVAKLSRRSRDQRSSAFETTIAVLMACAGFGLHATANDQPGALFWICMSGGALVLGLYLFLSAKKSLSVGEDKAGD